ncbi:Eukaryotic translation initiation factor 4E [Nymphon striatum]|nr:Eukaryotic translation initiation factor 4E [Nymphon striatum]
MATETAEIIENAEITKIGEVNENDNQSKELDIAPELLIKHPLQNRWTLWFFKNDTSKQWSENLCKITSFDTVEDFWALYNHIELASKISHRCDYSLFKDGVKPMWEDDRNKKGGRWLINLTKAQRSRDLDNFWLETLLCLIGETFEDVSDDICGAVVNVRIKGDKIGVWTNNAEFHDNIIRVGKKLKEVLQIPQKVTLGYEVHADTMSKSSSTVKTRLMVLPLAELSYESLLSQILIIPKYEEDSK